MKTVPLSRGRATALCLHGFLGALDDWVPLAEAVGPDVGVTSVALPGHGSPMVADFAGAVRELQALIRSQKEPPHVVGYSMGGRIALAAALDPKPFIASLTVISASPGLPSAAACTERARADDRLAALLALRGLNEFVRDWYAQPLFASLARRPALLRALLTRRARGRAADRAAALRVLSVGRQPSLWRALPTLQSPALFIAGEGDVKYRDLLARAAGLCPRARLLTVPNAGHFPHLERPAFVFAAMREVFKTEEEKE